MFRLITKDNIQIATMFFYIYSCIEIFINFYYFKNFNYSDKAILVFSSLYVQFIVFVILIICICIYYIIKTAVNKDFKKLKKIVKIFISLLVSLTFLFIVFNHYIINLALSAFVFVFNQFKNDYVIICYILLITINFVIAPLKTIASLTKRFNYATKYPFYVLANYFGLVFLYGVVLFILSIYILNVKIMELSETDAFSIFLINLLLIYYSILLYREISIFVKSISLKENLE